MKKLNKIGLLAFIIMFILSCGVKKTRNMLVNGDYDAAIKKSVEGLRSNKNSKGNQEYVLILEEAFAKAKERDLRNIATWSKEQIPSNYEKIFNTYSLLEQRQEQIRPLLPLQVFAENRTAVFEYEDYSDELVTSKNKLVTYLYDNSKALLLTNGKLNCRRAYEDLKYVNELVANYKDVLTLKDKAFQKGLDYVFVSTKNETNMVIPSRLQQDLLDFSTYGLNDQWTVYHNKKTSGIDYDYEIIVGFRNIIISPEQIKEREFIKEKQIKDGEKNVVDTKGNIVKDNFGNPIKTDNIITIKAQVYEYRQYKSVQIMAKVDYIDGKSKQFLKTFPISSEYVFDYIYANYNGDKRACDDQYLTNFNKRAVAFPSNEQMIYDTSEDLKRKLKDIMNNYHFRG
ncbi:hypothetical protein [Flavobacterium branchiophilum]|uniref:Probable lipoprotein n=1 Tax=Flavobacterium branchiophilum (strain FL-15) TaxID=1034807 RepID=G2Z129_FLABF|nr:hypothetical protein [Flavobacterium branchiophilum]CCB69588.1 Probable lipoprotein precursor [Flavobacterium branchiophilum FL-15]